MDANLTRHFLLLGKENWAACTDANGNRIAASWDDRNPGGNAAGLDYDSTREQLRLQPRLIQFRKSSGTTNYRPKDRRGAGRDRFGNWYWIAESQTEILVNSAGNGITSHFWSACDGSACDREPVPGGFAPVEAAIHLPETYRGLAVTEDHYLVVGLVSPDGLLVWDLFAGGPPKRFLWPHNIPFAPFDISARAGGGVFILDRVNARYWELDRYFRPCGGVKVPITLPRRETFQPVDLETMRRIPERLFRNGISLEYASPLDATDYVAIESLPDGSVLLLRTDDRLPFSAIVRYLNGHRQGEPVSLQAMQDFIDPSEAATFTLRGHDIAVVANRLYVVAREGEQIYSFEWKVEDNQLHLEAQADYVPLRLFEGKGIVAAQSRVYYDFSDRWLPAVAQSRPRFVHNAIFYTQVMDSQTPQCVWHRVVIDACIPGGSAVEVLSAAADEERRIGIGGWNREPAPYLRGPSEQPYNYHLAEQGLSTWELLLQTPKGRYCQLRIRLTGDGSASPRIHAIRVYYPRFSYLDRYLPGVYRQDKRSASFLDRFLANFEGLFTGIEDQIALARVLFDVRSAPPEFLDWLASWFGVALDPGWDAFRRQLFLSHAMEFFQYRGTVFGLRMALRLALDKCPAPAIFDLANNTGEASGFRIVEQFRTRQISPVLLGDNTASTQVSAAKAKWTPDQGGAALSAAYSKAIGASPSVSFPVAAPADATALAAWTEFCDDALGFIPATDASVSLWQDFLSRRYRRIAAWNKAYSLSLTAFTDIAWPIALPADGAPLRDWYEFHTVALATRALAHRFTVLIPVPAGSNPNSSEQIRRRLLAQRVIDLEKPAHTTYDVKNYWNLFLVGAARLGEDTVLGQGSRDPNLLPAFTLGQSFAGEGYLAAGFPRNAAGRQILGEGFCRTEKENS